MFYGGFNNQDHPLECLSFHVLFSVEKPQEQQYPECGLQRKREEW